MSIESRRSRSRRAATADIGAASIRAGRSIIARAFLVAGLVLIVVGSFGPWLRSGDRLRSSYELFEVAERLGFLGEGPLRWLPRVWICVPLLAAVAFALCVVDRNLAAGAVGIVVGVYAVVVSAGVLRSPLRAEWGCALGALGGAVTVLSASAVASVPSKRMRTTQ